MNISRLNLSVSVLHLTIWLESITLTHTQRTKKTKDSGYDQLLGNKSSNVSDPLNLCSSSGEEYHCPLWHYCNKTGQCVCANVSQYKVKCDTNGEISVLDGYWITFDNIQLRSEVGQCIFSYYRHQFWYHLYQKIPSNASDKYETCGYEFNRQGTLCGRCKVDHYPLAYSYNLTCVKCENVGYSWLTYVMLAFIPLTVFYLLILLFQVSILHSNLEGFVFYCQIICFPDIWKICFLIFQKKGSSKLCIEILLSFFSIWSLDWLRPFSNGICLKYNSLFVNSLDLTVSLYPLLLVLLTYKLISLYNDGQRAVVFIFNPIRSLFNYFKVKFEIRNSLVDAFSTFFLLSSVKLMSVAFDILAPVRVDFLAISGEHSHTYRLHSDPSIPYFGREHFLYAVVCLTIITIFVIIPGLILVLYPLSVFQQLLNKFPLKLKILIRTFLDTYFGSYKDGTKPGSWDCQWFGTLIFFYRIFLLIGYGFTLNVMSTMITSMTLTVLCILLVLIEPYKSSNRNYFFTMYLLCLDGAFLGILGCDPTALKSYDFIKRFHYFCLVFAFAPFLCTTILIFYRMIQQKALQQKKTNVLKFQTF